MYANRQRHSAKVEALEQSQAKPLEEKGEKPLRVSHAAAWQANAHAKDVLFEGQYRKAKGKRSSDVGPSRRRG